MGDNKRLQPIEHGTHIAEPIADTLDRLVEMDTQIDAAGSGEWADQVGTTDGEFADVGVSGVEMIGASVEAGPAWSGDATLELFGSPAEELDRLAVREILGGYYQQVGVTWDSGTVLHR